MRNTHTQMRYSSARQVKRGTGSPGFVISAVRVNRWLATLFIHHHHRRPASFPRSPKREERIMDVVIQRSIVKLQVASCKLFIVSTQVHKQLVLPTTLLFDSVQS